MSDYYEQKAESLSEALEACEVKRQFTKRLVFRGQRIAEWELKSGLFRFRETEEERANRFKKTIAFTSWCKQQPNLPAFSDDQLLHIAQHYGMPTDLLDFSTSLEVAAFFAIGAPQHSLSREINRAALFVLDPDDLAALPKLTTLPAGMKKLVQMYVGAVQEHSVPGLSRLVAQNGLFVRDVGGSLEGLTDPRFSLLDIASEHEIGHSMLLRKISFTPQESDIQLLAKRGCTYDRIFPPPNDIERHIARFDDWFAAWEYEQKRDKATVVVDLGGRALTHTTNIETWDTGQWENWTRLNLTTDRFVRPQSRELTDWEIPLAEITSESPSPHISAYIRQAHADGSGFKSRFELQLISMNERRKLPPRFNIALETLISFPYSDAQLELTLRIAMRLFLEAIPFGNAGALKNTANGQQALARVFGKHERWFSLDIICHGDGYSRKVVVPDEAFIKLKSIKQAIEKFENTDIGKEYGKSKSLSDGIYHLLFHRPQFRTVFEPDEAIALWSHHVIPWQTCFGEWDAAILNPFMVEHIGHS